MTRLRKGYPLLLVLLASPALAQQRTHDITPDDYFTLNTITELAVSPDGKHVAYCLATWDRAEDNRKTDLWVVATDGKRKPARLTFDRANDRKPKWSADGKSIYFLGNRKRAAETKPPFDGAAQVWRVEAAGGDPKAVTREPGGVSGYDYAPEADALFFTKEVDHADDDEFSKLRAKFAKVEYGHGKRKVSEVHRLDVNTWRAEKLIDEKRYVREFAVTADGKRVALVSAFDDSVVKSEGESRVDVWEGGKVVTPPTDVYRAKAASPWAGREALAGNSDGTRVAVCAGFDAYTAEVVVGTKDSESWTVKQVSRGGAAQVRGYGSPLAWTTNDGLIFLGDLDGAAGLVLADVKNHTINPLIDRRKVIYGLSASGGAKARPLLQAERDRFPQLVLHPLADRSLVDPNPHTATWKLPSVQHITWKAPDGAAVGGVLELPYGYKKGDRLPLVVALHGGPTTSTKADLAFDPHNGRLYFAARGYAVLLPNYRGSTGYGDQFVTDLIGNENDLDVKDILAGIQHLIKEGIADPDRVGVMGWSNGGYLTNCLITLKDSPVRFKAASCGAGILDTVAEWGFNDEPAYPMVFKKGLPWEQPEIYRKTSPTYALGNVTTPTLIHVGGNDERCPPGHSRMLYRALKEYKKVPTELVVYPGEPHGLTKLSNRKAKMEWDLAWFDRYLKSPQQ